MFEGVEITDNNGMEESCALLDTKVCSNLHACIEKNCPTDCHEKVHATGVCIFEKANWCVDVCSSGFASAGATATVATVVGSAVFGWLLMM